MLQHVSIEAPVQSTCWPISNGRARLLKTIQPREPNRDCQCYLLGTPDTSRSGRNTRNALRAFTSNPSLISDDSAVLIKLWADRQTHIQTAQARSGKLRFTNTQSIATASTIKSTNTLLFIKYTFHLFVMSFF